MQPILMLAVVAVAAVALGTGFLSNDIDLWIQQFGVGSGDIRTPTDHVLVDFTIVQQPQNTSPETYRNLVTGCELTPDDTVGIQQGSEVTEAGVTFTVNKPSEMVCKLTDREGNIIAEGTATSAAPFAAGVPVPVDTEPDVTVTDVHDVIVVVHANTYSMGDAEPSSP